MITASSFPLITILLLLLHLLLFPSVCHRCRQMATVFSVSEEERRAEYQRLANMYSLDTLDDLLEPPRCAGALDHMYARDVTINPQRGGGGGCFACEPLNGR